MNENKLNELIFDYNFALAMIPEPDFCIARKTLFSNLLNCIAYDYKDDYFTDRETAIAFFEFFKIDYKTPLMQLYKIDLSKQIQQEIF